MPLSDEETRLLKKLQQKAKEPDAPPSSRVLNISIDLGDEAQVKRAGALGLLGLLRDDDADDDAGDDDDDAGDDEEDTPRRRGYFKD